MVIDTSAIIAIALNEPDAAGLEARIADDAIRADLGSHRYGKGHHSAALTYGDCFSYALAVSRGEVLLFKRDDYYPCHPRNSPVSLLHRGLSSRWQD